MAVRSSILLLSCLLAACGGPDRVSRSDFAEFAADAFCERLRECARGDFERAFFGRKDCLEHFERDFRAMDDAYRDDDCDYDDEGAGKAMKNLRTMSCKEFYKEEYVDDYDKIWDC